MNKRIKEINLDQIGEYSLNLAQKVFNSGWRPNHILYVERAGLFIGHAFARFFDCSISGIHCRRIGDSFKTRMQFVLGMFPRVLTRWLREIEIKSNIHSIFDDRRVYIESLYPPKDKSLLIVDDAIDTGYSAKAVLCFLFGKGYSKDNLKMAVLTNTYKDPEYHAHFSVFDQAKFVFPWSPDSREYSQAWKLYHEYKSSIL